MYSPKISEELVQKLYKIAKQERIHMTTLVNNILSQALFNPMPSKGKYVSKVQIRDKM